MKKKKKTSVGLSYLSANWTNPHRLPTGIFTWTNCPCWLKTCLRCSSVTLESKPPTKICNEVYSVLPYLLNWGKNSLIKTIKLLTVVLFGSSSLWVPWELSYEAGKLKKKKNTQNRTWKEVGKGNMKKQSHYASNSTSEKIESMEAKPWMRFGNVIDYNPKILA